MEINVTKWVNKADEMYNYSASCAELGEDAGKVTWQNALEAMENEADRFVINDDDDQAARDYFEGFGAWDDIDEWSNHTLNAVVLQDVAAAIREMEHFDSFEEWQEACENGHCAGNLYCCEDQWYFYLGV